VLRSCSLSLNESCFEEERFFTTGHNGGTENGLLLCQICHGLYDRQLLRIQRDGQILYSGIKSTEIQKYNKKRVPWYKHIGVGGYPSSEFLEWVFNDPTLQSPKKSHLTSHDEDVVDAEGDEDDSPKKSHSSHDGDDNEGDNEDDTEEFSSKKKGKKSQKTSEDEEGSGKKPKRKRHPRLLQRRSRRMSEVCSCTCEQLILNVVEN